jgi:hypothetical protein
LPFRPFAQRKKKSSVFRVRLGISSWQWVTILLDNAELSHLIRCVHLIEDFFVSISWYRLY